MATGKDPVRSASAWLLAREQHGVLTRRQLTGLGYSEAAIRQRLARGRLHRLLPGVYAVGRPQVGADGRRMAAVLACGEQALLSHRSAAAVLRIRKPRSGEQVEVVVPRGQRKRPPGVRVYQRSPPGSFPAALRTRRPRRVPVTGPAVTLVDLASCLPTGQLEAAVNEADHLDLVDPEALREAVAHLPRRPGARRLRELLDATGHALTSTALERRFLPLALEAGLPLPTTQKSLGPHRVDFYWESLGLVVETDSLRYHRTAFKQAADKRRDNRNAQAGLLTLRFSHGQVRFEPAYVKAELRRAARGLTANSP
ncbi:MAG TPA: type IV toxin-antitoxin system AbiEi family antitoxin domain-containing protein [Solirubrobacterales bacterium]|nr:type IV toxin-antitoxin system AbiEi family antitoxin domain-containing protein [Solirubrobacterales bacterium]